MKEVRILGVRVHDVTMDETLAAIGRYVAERRPHQIVTVNPEFVMAAQHDEGFREILNGADLALPDGQGLLWAARRVGSPLRERVCGSDLVLAIAALAPKKGYRVYFLGAAPGVAARAAERLRECYAGLQVAGTYAGSPQPAEDDDIVARVREAAPDLLLVAYGAPRQDRWIRRNMARLEVPVCIGVGGSLDFVAGVTRRAPMWMRRHGLEWLHRLAQQPWRWRRMLALPRFAWRVLREDRWREPGESTPCVDS